jgi:hypothetical protein
MATPAANDPRDAYAGEFAGGYGHHIAANGLFDRAITQWNADDLANASVNMRHAGDEYSRATDQYHAMIGLAGADADRAFAEGLENVSLDMGEATSRYLMSMNASLKGNKSEALAYFHDGQAFVDTSQDTLNCTLEAMPQWLQGRQ